MSLLIIGTVAFDAIETPFGKTDKILGGAATYISLAASKLYNKVNVVSVVGYDFPDEYLQTMRSKGIDTSGIQIVKDNKTFFWSGKYHNDMNTRDTLETQLNVLENFDPVIPPAFHDCEYLMLGNLDPTIQRKLLERLPKRPKLVVMDTMNFWMEIANESLMETISMVDVLSINDEETRLLTGEYSLVKAAKKILTMGPKYLIIKKGEHGALLFDEDQIFFAPALPLEEVFDPTGAGDTFAGGFLGYIARSGEISFDAFKNAIIHGSALASLCVERFGPERLISLTSNELSNRIKSFRNLTHFEVSEELILHE